MNCHVLLFGTIHRRKKRNSIAKFQFTECFFHFGWCLMEAAYLMRQSCRFLCGIVREHIQPYQLNLSKLLYQKSIQIFSRINFFMAAVILSRPYLSHRLHTSSSSHCGKQVPFMKKSASVVFALLLYQHQWHCSCTSMCAFEIFVWINAHIYLLFIAILSFDLRSLAFE